MVRLPAPAAGDAAVRSSVPALAFTVRSCSAAMPPVPELVMFGAVTLRSRRENSRPLLVRLPVMRMLPVPVPLVAAMTRAVLVLSPASVSDAASRSMLPVDDSTASLASATLFMSMSTVPPVMVLPAARLSVDVPLPCCTASLPPAWTVPPIDAV